MEILTLVGGTPGIDCGSYCEFCYFKTVNYKTLDSFSISCRNCPPHQSGCPYCNEIIKEVKNGFKNPYQVLYELRKRLIRERLSGNLEYNDIMINIGSWADIFFYPHLPLLVQALKSWNLPVHLGYTSGKGIKNDEITKTIISWGIDEISFSAFSTDPVKRRRWMRDETPEASLRALKMFIESTDVNASTVVMPGIIDEEDIIETCSTLEEWGGVKSFVLSRFANYQHQGLILNERPIMDGLEPHSFPEFQELVKNVAKEFNFKITGAPASDPANDIPYALSKDKNKDLLNRLNPIVSEATIITSSLSAPYLQNIIEEIDKDKNVNVISVNKEIGDLITTDDLYSVDLSTTKNKIILPGKALVHDKLAEKIFSKDGKIRSVVRGPDILCPQIDGNQTKKELLEFEFNAFNELINRINYNLI